MQMLAMCRSNRSHCRVLLLQYLEDLDCPLEFDAASAERPEVMDWLLHYAVDLIYEDHGAHPCVHPCSKGDCDCERILPIAQEKRIGLQGLICSCMPPCSGEGEGGTGTSRGRSHGAGR